MNYQVYRCGGRWLLGYFSLFLSDCFEFYSLLLRDCFEFHSLLLSDRFEFYPPLLSNLLEFSKVKCPVSPSLVL